MTKDRKLAVKFKESAGVAVCFNRRKLATEYGVIVRSFSPLEYKSWKNIPLHDREALMERVKDKFWVDLSVPFFWDFLHRSMGKKYNSHMSLMSSYFKRLFDSSHSIEKLKISHTKMCPRISGSGFATTSLHLNLRNGR